MRNLILIATILLNFSPLYSKVQSCILDGGNDRGQRLCGSEEYLSAVRSVYPSRSSSSAYVERAIIGDGDGTAAGSTEWDCTERLYSGTDTSVRVNVPHNTTINAANSGSTVLPATRANALSCFQGAATTDVCNFWSTNHGFYGDSDSSVYGRPQSSISLMGGSPFRVASVTAAHLQASFNTSNCGTTRYILNNCFSGGMHEMIFDSERNIIPNRCGVASTNYFQPSIKSTIVDEGIDPLDRTRPTTITGREGQFFPGRGTYNFTESITNAFRAKKTYDGTTSRTDISLDDAYFISLKTNLANELPTISSGYFLEDYFRGHVADPRFNLADAAPLQGAFIARELTCARSVLGDNYENSPIAELMNQVSNIIRVSETGTTETPTAVTSGLTATERTTVRNDLTRVQNQIQLYENFMCSEFWATECNGLSATEKRDFVQRKYRDDYITRRNLLSLRYQDLARRRNWDAAQLVSNELTTLERDSSFFRRYDFLVNRLGQTARFYQSAPAEKLKQYLTLRRCETTAFSGRATP